jgi:hypothetical protein
MPDRGLLAPLSPHEDVTLRRVALGIASPTDLPTRGVEAAKVLGADRGVPSRIAAYPYRQEALPRPSEQCRFRLISGAPDEGPAKIGRLLHKGA